MIATNPYNKVILINPATIKANTIIGSEVDESVIRTSAVKVQTIDLQKIIGTPLLRKLQQLVKEEDISSATAYKVLLDEYITPYLGAMIVADIAFDLSYKYRNKGAVDSTDTNLTSPSYSDLAKLTERHKVIAGEYRNFLCEFLYANSSDYPELAVCGDLLHADIHKDYECPILI